MRFGRCSCSGGIRLRRSLEVCERCLDDAGDAPEILGGELLMRKCNAELPLEEHHNLEERERIDPEAAEWCAFIYRGGRKQGSLTDERKNLSRQLGTVRFLW